MLKWLKQYVAGGLSNTKSPFAAEPLPDVLDLTDPQTIASFQGIARVLRAQKPVCPVASGGFLLLNPDDVKAAFSNKMLSNQPSRFSALAPKNTEKHVAASVATNIPPFLDAPRHIEIRNWLSRGFFQRLRAFEPQIADIAAAHAARIVPGTPYLLVEDIARAFVVDTIGKFVGVEVTPDDMKHYTGALFRLFAPAADVETFKATNEGLAHARQRLIAALDQRRADQAACLLTVLDQADLPGRDAKTKSTMIADNALLILADGVENVEAAMATVMMRATDLGARITPGFVRETITLDTPGQTIPRIAAQDFQIGGERITTGTPVFLSLASANAAANPAEDFSFGMGRHKCIGEPLAIAMMTAFCAALTERGPKIDASGLHYAAMFGHKWPRGVSVTFTR